MGRLKRFIAEVLGFDGWKVVEWFWVKCERRSVQGRQQHPGTSGREVGHRRGAPLDGQVLGVRTSVPQGARAC